MRDKDLHYYVGWVSVDGAGSQNIMRTRDEAIRVCDQLQAETDARVYPDGTINPFGYRHHVVGPGGIVYRATLSVVPGTRAQNV